MPAKGVIDGDGIPAKNRGFPFPLLLRELIPSIGLRANSPDSSFSVLYWVLLRGKKR